MECNENGIEFVDVDKISDAGSDISVSEHCSDTESDQDDWDPTWEEGNQTGTAENVPPNDFATESSVNEYIQSLTEAGEFFNYFFDDSLIATIVQQTNLYAEQQLKASKTEGGVQWHPVTPDEFRVALAVMMAQSIVVKPEDNLYWSKHPVVSTPFFPNAMTYRRHMAIKRFLHFADNTSYDPAAHPYPRLHKIWPVYEYLNEKFRQAYIPERELTVLDESVMRHKGRSGWLRYGPGKRMSSGMRTVRLTECESGYIWSTFIYMGGGNICNDEFGVLTIPSQIVLTLMKPLLNKGYCLTTNEFYTSIRLAEILVSNGTDTYGKLKPRQGSRTARELSKGGIEGFRRGKITVVRWNDKSKVYYLSTVHGLHTVDVHIGGVKRSKPKVIVDYNAVIDRDEEVIGSLSNIPSIRKCGRKYYKPVFFDLLEKSLWNSYILYTKMKGNISYLQYRLKVVDNIMEKYHSKEFSSKGGGSRRVRNLSTRLTEQHFLEPLPATERKAMPTRRCVVCCTKNDESGKRIRRETRYFCPDCNVGLCLTPCFKSYHTNVYF